ncbi:MAG: EF-P lysine aminoacylase EpmA [Halopseudomonas sp.]
MISWQPSASLEAIRARAELNAQIRQFFAERGVLEVDTPVLSAAAVSDPHLEPMQSQYCGPGFDQGLGLFLQTSPEYAMKRLLAAGSGPIYQLAKAFRNGESGRKHNPEFCMLEWYRPDFDDRQLMDEVEALVAAALGRDDFQRISYRKLFQQQLDCDPHTAPVDQLRLLTRQRLELSLESDDRDEYLNVLISHVLEPALIKPTFVYDYPASQAALARVENDNLDQPVAKRFELFVEGVELANGYFELTDSQEQARRFDADLETRVRLGYPCHPVDQRLVAALEAGMPDCAGVALGVDRLLMLRLGKGHLDQVLAFPLRLA